MGDIDDLKIFEVLPGRHGSVSDFGRGTD